MRNLIDSLLFALIAAIVLCLVLGPKAHGQVLIVTSLGEKAADPTALTTYIERAKQENKRIVVWTGTPGRLVPGTISVRNDSDMAPTHYGRRYATVGVPAAGDFVWFSFPVDTPDWALASCRTDGTTEPVRVADCGPDGCR